MVPEGAATVLEKPMASSERRVTGRTDTLCTGYSDAYAETWLTASSNWWPIYMSSPSHLKIAGVQESHKHTQEHLQAIQEHKDQILSP